MKNLLFIMMCTPLALVFLKHLDSTAVHPMYSMVMV
jgi:hypothetical protein